MWDPETGDPGLAIESMEVKIVEEIKKHDTR